MVGGVKMVKNVKLNFVKPSNSVLYKNRYILQLVDETLHKCCCILQEETKVQRKRNIKLFNEILDSMPSLMYKTTWSDAQQMLLDNPRFTEDPELQSEYNVNIINLVIKISSVTEFVHFYKKQKNFLGFSEVFSENIRIYYYVFIHFSTYNLAIHALWLQMLKSMQANITSSSKCMFYFSIFIHKITLK